MTKQAAIEFLSSLPHTAAALEAAVYHLTGDEITAESATADAEDASYSRGMEAASAAEMLCHLAAKLAA